MLPLSLRFDIQNNISKDVTLCQRPVCSGGLSEAAVQAPGSRMPGLSFARFDRIPAPSEAVNVYSGEKSFWVWDSYYWP